MSTDQPAQLSYDLEDVISTAFAHARERGKPDWRRMTVAVLKNRMLQITKGKFRESLHDAISIRELLTRFPHLVQVNHDVVELVAAELPETGESARSRLREDLWRAVVDFASGKQYTWDAKLGVAREAKSPEELRLPTISREEMAGWRAEFAKTRGTSPELERWRTEALGTSTLPFALRGSWNGFVRDSVLARLENWFSAHDIAPPKIVESVPPSTKPERASLREVALACVATMTEEELAELRFSPAVILRARESGKLK